MAFVVLAHAGDAEAELLAAELTRRAGEAAVALVWAEELLLGSRFTHRLDDRGAVTEVELASGTTIDSERLEGVACRLTHAPVPHFERAAEPDRRYAMVEAHALLLSWLASLECPVLNPPTSRGLAAPALSPPELFTLATSCGLAGRRFRLSGTDSWLEPLAGEPRGVLVAGERVLGTETEADAAGYVELARRLGCPVLGVQIAPSGEREGERLVCGIDPLPSLGPDGAAAIADLLVGVPA